MSGGFTPSVHLFSQSRGALKWDEGANAFLPASKAERTHSAGSCRGITGLAAVLEDGAEAGAAAAAACGFTGASHRFEVTGDDTAAEAKPTSQCIARDARREGFRGFPERRHGQ